MLKKICILGISLLSITLVACNDNKAESTAGLEGESTTENNLIESTDENLVEETKVGNVLEVDEKQIALKYFEQYLNSDNKEEKYEFVNLYVHEDFDDVLKFAVEIPLEKEIMFFEPSVISSVEFTNEFINDGLLVLVEGIDYTEEEIEAIILFNEGKLAYIYQSRDREDLIGTFKQLRGLFN